MLVLNAPEMPIATGVRVSPAAALIALRIMQRRADPAHDARCCVAAYTRRTFCGHQIDIRPAKEQKGVVQDIAFIGLQQDAAVFVLCGM